jgi:hypothetical protein
MCGRISPLIWPKSFARSWQHCLQSFCHNLVTYQGSLKKRVTRFSTYGFFHQTIPSRPLIHGLTHLFAYVFRIREVIRQSRWHSGINEIAVVDTAVSLAKISDFIVEYLREFEAICKKALALVSVA